MPSTEALARKAQLPQPISVDSVDVTTYDGFGKPWRVVPRAVFLWSKLDGGENTGTAKKGRVVGEQLRICLPDGPRVRLPRTSNELYEAQWACLSHEKCGTLFEEVDVDQGLDMSACLVADEFRQIYRDVVDLCHQRIYTDNLDTLWAGDRGRLPDRSFIEAKLFRPSTLVLHAVGPERNFVGGGILHNFHVPPAKPGMRSCKVTYIDDLATVRNSHAGRALWKAVTNIPVDLVVLHSILMESTVAFWTSCGFHRVDRQRPEDLEWLSKDLYTKSGAVHSLDVDAFLALLPRSDLPLFVCCLGNGVSASEDPEVALLAPFGIEAKLGSDEAAP